MKRVLLVLTLVAAGCTGEPERADTSLPASVPAPTSTPTIEFGNIQAAALAIEDMPSGWSEYTPTEEDVSSNEYTKIGGTIGVQDEPYPVQARAQVFYEEGQPSVFVPRAFVSNTVKLFATEADAQNLLNDYRTAAATRSWTETRQALGTIDFSLAAMSFDRLGDETFAVRLTARGRDPDAGSEFEDRVDYVLFRVGRVVSWVYTLLTDSGVVARKSESKMKAYAAGQIWNGEGPPSRQHQDGG